MDRGAWSHLIPWLIVPAAGALVSSALSLPYQPYTGVILREDAVVAVDRGSPGELAGLRAGDRLTRGSGVVRLQELAVLGVPLKLTRERGGERRAVRLVPRALPPGERRMMAAMLAVASGFVLLGGWVWSERRDGLTRPFYLLSLAFASLLAPPPRFSWPPAVTLHSLLYSAVTLVLPALCIHFFAMFPEPHARGRITAGVTAAYGTAALLFAASVVVLGLRLAGHPAETPAWALLQSAAAVWFAAGLLAALVLFGRSYLRAESTDARRRLRVALLGTVLGVGPLATAIVLRNLSPGTAVPGERWAVVLTLLVPLSFAWATVVHRIFDFRVAVRAAATALALILVGAATYFTGEWLAGRLGGRGMDLTGVALAMVGLGAALAGPARPWARKLSGAIDPLRDSAPLAETLLRAAMDRDDSARAVLTRACETLAATLRLDHCAALEVGASGESNVRGDAPWVSVPSVLPSGSPRLAPELGRRFAEALGGRSEPVAVDDSAFTPGDRDALEAAGVQWVLPVGSDPMVGAILLGRRLTGAWLDRREVDDLGRFARHLAVALENVCLRQAARSHGALDRSLEQAGAIQAHLLPRRAPIYPTLDCAAATLSSEPVGGDYYDFVERSGREFTLAVGDAAGKGVPAALLLAGVQARFRNEALRGRDPGQLLSALNLELAHLDQPEKFVGLLCARVEVRRGRITFANAGLTPPLVRRRTGACQEVTAGGILLGVQADAQYPSVSVELSAGDVALIYTDGLTEARQGEELFGPDRLRRILDQHAGRRAADILAAVLSAVRGFAAHPLDDLTVVVLKQLADPIPARDRPPALPLKWRLASADTVR